ncbi:hypothetical protein GCM10011414_13350 [Croceivirga lutea]|uniref:serine hydrolase domain-containing protein n=1 Tax=Croceivirga lutea TaxID=1775167 RepID=UPI001639C7A9|nr:serine hydrolase domain-containing protein [Croceivirga lutea]GGG45124.1 hypothetical protein GCM10011414_13350 [Croceivirga lutea]
MKKLSYLLIVILLFWGCSSDSEITDDEISTEQPNSESSAKELISFSFSSNTNSIPVNSEATLSSNSASLFLPVNTELSSLIPNFSISSKASLYLGSQELVSGETSIDLTAPATLKVVAEDGSSKNYEVTVTTAITSLTEKMNVLMDTYDIPGIQLAIVKNEKLVYQHSFGLADPANNTAVTNESLFRIASISKPITAIGILKLVDDTSLSLNQRVFGTGGVLGTDYGTPPYAAGIEQITVRHLLEHTSGWTNNPFDPMFANIDFSQSEVIDDMLDNRPLETTPGSTYYYSNFGYSVLGRIIEKVTGQSYEAFIKSAVLSPAGISKMELGGNTLEEQYANEVVYLDQEGFSPYGTMNITRMDSHGGWLASATDLARFITVVDRNSSRPDIVSAGGLQELYFGFQNWVFYGSLPGTSTAISRVDDEYSYVILANTRTIPIKSILDNFNNILREEILARNNWPSYDLF